MSNYKVSEDLIEKWYKELKDKDIGEQIKNYSYRPFDNRFTIYNPKILQRARKDIMDNFLSDNLGIYTTKQLSTNQFHHSFVTENLADRCYISLQTREVSYVFPLYLYEGNKLETIINGQEKLNFKGTQHTLRIKKDKEANINKNILDLLEKTFGKKINPEEIFNYIYAILYSNIYREKYNEFLKIDFPKISFTKDVELFYRVAELGKKLIDLHLLKSPKLDKPIASFLAQGDNLVKKREFLSIQKPAIKELKGSIDSYKKDSIGSIWINEKQYFEGVDEKAWNHYIGGYQPLDKWLKDRIGKILSSEDVNHYLKVITALKYTIETQKEIDKLYPEIEKSLIQ